MIVAIDGPAGAGKSTVARLVADRIGARYLDTGAMYRALTWLAQREGVDHSDGAALGALAEAFPAQLTLSDEGPRVAIAGVDVTAEVRGDAVTAAVSEVAAHGTVREAIVDQQREMINSGDWVADGRDIGTVVAPTAELKIYLTASLEERARRRQGDLERAGTPTDRGWVADDLARRDQTDATRAVSPLRAADDAEQVDTSDLSIDEVVDLIVRRVEELRG